MIHDGQRTMVSDVAAGRPGPNVCGVDVCVGCWNANKGVNGGVGEGLTRCE
jgi:hypothetical protein